MDKSPQGSNKIYSKHNIEFFTHTELLADYMSHILAPISCDVISNKADILSISNMWNSQPHNFPKIKRTVCVNKFVNHLNQSFNFLKH